MTPTSRSLHRYSWLSLAALLATGGAGCLCPPCPEDLVVVGPGAALGASAPVAPGSRLVLWDGDGAGAGAQGWDACDPKAGCSKVGPAPGGGVGGTTGLKLHGDGPAYLGMGWNLFGWYPENAGYDMTPYSHLTFQIRVEAKSPADGPDPTSVNVVLGCSHNKKDSATVPLQRYEKGFADGKWHKVAIPVAQFTKGRVGAAFDAQSFWELRIATWSATPRHFDIYLDDIALEKQ